MRVGHSSHFSTSLELRVCQLQAFQDLSLELRIGHSDHVGALLELKIATGQYIIYIYIYIANQQYALNYHVSAGERSDGGRDRAGSDGQREGVREGGGTVY